MVSRIMLDGDELSYRIVNTGIRALFEFFSAADALDFVTDAAPYWFESDIFRTRITSIVNIIVTIRITPPSQLSRLRLSFNSSSPAQRCISPTPLSAPTDDESSDRHAKRPNCPAGPPVRGPTARLPRAALYDQASCTWLRHRSASENASIHVLSCPPMSLDSVVPSETRTVPAAAPTGMFLDSDSRGPSAAPTLHDSDVDSPPQTLFSDSKGKGRATPRYVGDLGFVPIPRRLRHDPERPFEFTWVLNVLFGFGATFTVANLYYCQPLLIQLAEAFGVSYSRVGNIPTLLQAGYATGILFISPLGDLVRRRGLILLLVILSTALTIGLAVTSNLVVFEALSFLVGLATVTPQIMIPLAADLAPPERRASALSVVISGLAFGILIARVIAGIIAEFTSWRVVYYFAIGVQLFVLSAGYLLVPDYPAKNPDLSYFGILKSLAKFAFTEPLLIQGCLVNFASSACFTNFWVTLTFLLGGAPYNYSTLVIGLFGIVGIFGVACGPLAGRLIDRLVPWYASLVCAAILVGVQAIQTGAGDKSAAVIVVVIMGTDVFRQALQTSLASAIFGIDANARARINAVFILSLFLGQITGTSAGTQVYTRYGWRASAVLNMGFYAWGVLVQFARGPRVGRSTWIGWEGGFGGARREKSVPVVKDVEKGIVVPSREKIEVEEPKQDSDNVESRV
uniref:MFS general substrate transporter n=1 Tax=Mycena chlorophos TaxID=658473 RepID=A0ABQ0M0Q8_MYCCL|nr:MFS general substrate transporter [Mycena chlorophos]